MNKYESYDLQYRKQAIQLFMSSSTSKYKSTPTFTFKGYTKSITSSNDPSALPSPDRYNPQKVSLNKSPTAKFPKAVRKQWDEIKSKKNVPGPGSFQPASFTTDGPKKTISKVLFKKFVSLTPGPDKYHGDSIVLMKKQPSFSMQKKTISLHDLLASRNNDKPSPTAYEQPIMKFKSASAITIGKSKRRSVILNQKYPGPGSYEAEKSYHSSVLSQSKCKIGRDKRNIDFSLRQKVPGPGSYDRRSFIEDNKAKQKGFSCRAKFLINSSSSKVPGPGSYQTPVLNRHHSSPQIKMAKAKRFTFTDHNIAAFKNNPGPGSFDLEGVDRMKFRSMSVHKFSKSKSNYLSDSIHNQSSEKLGPGFYNFDKYFSQRGSPQYSISKTKNRDLFKKVQKFPSPNSYNPKLSLVQQSQFTHKMQTSQRSNIIKHLANIPGPGQYQTHIPDRLGINFKFSKQRRQHIFDKSKSKQKLQINNQVYQPRESFPNPPKYMSVVPKIKFNQKNLNGYSK